MYQGRAVFFRFFPRPIHRGGRVRMELEALHAGRFRQRCSRPRRNRRNLNPEAARCV